MPIARFRLPNGKIARFQVPEGLSQEELEDLVAPQLFALSREEPKPEPRKAEDVGFIEGTMAALGRGISSFGDIASGYGVGATSAVGATDATRRQMEAIKAESQVPDETPGMTAAGIGKLYKEEGLLSAASEVPKYVSEQIMQAAPQMAVPLAAAKVAGALSGPAAPIVAPAVGIGTYALQQFGNFLYRQAQEKKDPEEIEVTKAALTAAGTAPLGYFADRFTLGLSSIGGQKAGVEVMKELAARRAAGAIGTGAVAKGVAAQAAKGATVGIIAEAPTEVLESVAERWQAGLKLDTDDAKDEYTEAFFGAAAVGGGLGAGSSAARSTGQYLAEKRALTPEKPATEGKTAFDQADEDEAGEVVTPPEDKDADLPDPFADINLPDISKEEFAAALKAEEARLGRKLTYPEQGILLKQVQRAKFLADTPDDPMFAPAPGQELDEEGMPKLGPGRFTRLTEFEKTLTQKDLIDAGIPPVKANYYARQAQSNPNRVNAEAKEAFRIAAAQKSGGQQILLAPSEEQRTEAEKATEESVSQYEEPLNPKVTPLVSALNKQNIPTTLSGDLYGKDLVYVDIDAPWDTKIPGLPKGWFTGPNSYFHTEAVAGLPTVGEMWKDPQLSVEELKRQNLRPMLRLARPGGAVSAAEAQQVTSAVEAALKKQGLQPTEKPEEAPATRGLSRAAKRVNEDDLTNAGFQPSEIAEITSRPDLPKNQDILEKVAMGFAYTTYDQSLAEEGPATGREFKQVSPQDIEAAPPAERARLRRVYNANILQRPTRAEKPDEAQGSLFAPGKQMGLDLGEATEETTRDLPKSLIEEAPFELEAAPGVAPGRTDIAAEEAAPTEGAPLRAVEKTTNKLFDFLRGLKPIAQAEQGVKNHQSAINNFIDEINEYVAPKEGATPEQRSENLAAINDFFDQYSLTEDAAEAADVLTKAKDLPLSQQIQFLNERTRLPSLSKLEGVNLLRQEFQDFMNERAKTKLGYTPAESALNVLKLWQDVVMPEGRVKTAIKALRNKLASTRTAAEQAAANYLGTFDYGTAVRSAAYDIANDVRTGENFKGQGKKEAELFQQYMEENFPAEVYQEFQSLVEAYKANFRKAANAMYALSKKQKSIAKLKEAGVSAESAGKLLDRYGLHSGTPGVFRPMHPAVAERVKNNDLNGALRLMARLGGKTSYYGRVAERLLALNLPTSIYFDMQGPMVQLRLDDVQPSLDLFLDNLKVQNPELHKDLFENATPRQTLEGLRIIKENKLLPEDYLNGPAFKYIYDSYNKLIRSLDAGGFYLLQEDAININQDVGGATYYTLLHEAVHAATAYAINTPDALSPSQKEALNNLKKLYEDAKQSSKLKPYGFTNLHEFVAEAFTNSEFQQLLRSKPYDEPGGPSMWSKFIRYVVELFAGKRDNMLFATLYNADVLMSSSRPAGPKAGFSAPLAANAAPTKSPLDGSWRTAPDVVRSRAWLNSLLSRPSWQEVKKNVGPFLETLSDATRQHYLGAFTLRQLKDLVGNRLGGYADAFINTLENMLDSRNTILQQVSDITKTWELYQSANPEETRKMNLVMISATLAGYDPDSPTRTPQNKAEQEVQDAWDVLPDEAKNIYRKVRDFYKERIEAYQNVILENVERAMIANNKTQAEIDARKQELREKFAKDRIQPYFPLKRFGKYWLQVNRTSPTTGKAEKKQFYMFESAAQRNAFRQQVANELLAEGKTVEEIMGGTDANNRPIQGILSEGNDLNKMLNVENLQDLQALKTIKDLVEASTGGTPQELKDSIQDSIDQLYLLTLPDQSARKLFINRKQVEGASADMLRAFTHSAFHMAYQHSRFEHAQSLYTLLYGAENAYVSRDSGFPADQRKVAGDYVGELRKRLTYAMNPTDTGVIPSFLSNLSFIWFLTAPASALVNMLGVPAFGLPVVGARFGWGKSSAAMAQYSKRFFSTGFKFKRGEGLTFPSLDRANLSQIEKQAFDRFVKDGLIDVTLSHDLVGMAEAPTNLYTGKMHKVMRALSYMFHNAEKYNREVVAMSTFKLAYDKAIADKMSPDKAMEKAIETAKDLTYRSMFDYSTLNKPRFFQPAYAKVILQFKQFAQQLTYLLGRSVYEWGTSQDKDVRDEARARVLGVLGMTGLFAGATGMPLFSTIASVIEAIHAVFSDDDEPPLDFENWFKNWSAETFGNFWGDSLSRGILTQATGLNLADRMSLNDLWFRDPRKSEDEVTAFQNMVINMLGPTAGLAINSVEALKAFNDGLYYRAAEKALPAVLKQPLVGIRYATEGALTMKGDTLVEDISAKEALAQSLGFSPERVAQRQKANIEMKSMEQKIINKRQDLMNAYFLAFDANDEDFINRVEDKIDRFNAMYPDYPIEEESLNRSIEGRYRRRDEAEETGGIPINKNLLPELKSMGAYGDVDEDE
jgi:hypothetical protein